MKVPPHFDAGIIVADVLWLLLTVLLILFAQATGEPILQPSMHGDSSFVVIWRTVNIGLVVITLIWIINTTVTAVGERT